MICLKVPERLSYIKIRIGPCSLTCIYAYMCPSKCEDELLGTHTVLALKYRYSDEVLLLPARRIPIRIACSYEQLIEDLW